MVCTTTRLLALFILLAVPRLAMADVLQFNWPVPSRVAVTERIHKKGAWATVGYDVELTPHEGGKLALRLTNLRLIDVAGQVVKEPAARKKLERAVKAGSAMPTMILARDGTFQDVGDMTPVIEAAMAASEVPAKERPKFLRFLKSPQVRAAMKMRASEFWTLWVGMWVGGELEPGRPKELTLETPLPDGSMLEQPMTAAHGGLAGPPGHIRLSYETRLSGATNSERMKRYVGSFLQQVGVELSKPIPPEMIEDVASFSSGEIVTDPSTLRPVQARSQRQLRIKIKGEPPRNLVEAHEYSFDWSKAKTR